MKTWDAVYQEWQTEDGQIHAQRMGLLIRCKDCKWWNTDEDECWLSGLDTDGYEYCSWAERKEE